MHAELLAPRNVDSSGVSSSAAVGVASLLALEAANGLHVSALVNIELDRCVKGHIRPLFPYEIQLIMSHSPYPTLQHPYKHFFRAPVTRPCPYVSQAICFGPMCLSCAVLLRSHHKSFNLRPCSE